METTYEWTVSSMETIPSVEDLSNVVYKINWRYSAKQGEHVADNFGFIILPDPNPANFTPYDSLTKEQVVSWLESSINVDSQKQFLDKRIEELKKPATVVLPNPW